MTNSVNLSENNSQKLSLVKKQDLIEKPKPVLIKKSANLSDFNQVVDSKNKLKLKKKSEVNSNTVEDVDFEKVDEKLFCFDAIKEMAEAKAMWEYKPEVVDKAYKTICKMWNKDQKSRNFVKHLISAFIPYNPWCRMINTPDELGCKCAILNHKISGIVTITQGLSPIMMEKLMMDCHANVENRTKYTPEEIEKYEEKLKTIPVEIRESRVAVMSESSTKFLQVETVQALSVFATEMLWHSDEMNFTIRKNMLNKAQEDVPQKSKLTKSQINDVAGNSVYGMNHKISDKTISALEKLKAELELNPEKR